MFKKFLNLVIMGSLLGVTGTALAADNKDDVKIGFVVKQPEEPWFQDEWKFAQKAADEKGFTLVKIGAVDGEKLITAIDNLGAQKAGGLIVCVPDVKLGPAVVAKTKAYNMKLMTVDDRLVDAKGNPIEDVHHMGISAYKIGELVGTSLADEVKARGWDMNDVTAMRLTFYQLPTAKDRTDGATAALVAAGLPEANIIDAPHKLSNTEEAFNAGNTVVTRTPDAKKWIVYGMNDEAVIGGVRALEGNGVPTEDIIGIGIGGSDSGINEFKKDETGFFGSVIISPLRHGYETADNMYEWIANGNEPEKLILTSGELATANNYHEVRKNMGLE